MSPPTSHVSGSRLNGLIPQEAAAGEGWVAHGSAGSQLHSLLYPLLQLLGRLLQLPLVYLVLNPASAHSLCCCAAEGILYRDPQLVPDGQGLDLKDLKQAAEGWPFHQAFPVQDEGGSPLADLHLFDANPRQLSASEQEQVGCIALSLRQILISLQKHQQTQAHLQAQLQATQTIARRYQHIFENSPEGLFQITPEGHYLLANSALAQMLGYDSPEDLRQNVPDLVSQIYPNPQDRQEFIQRMLTAGEVVVSEHPISRKDGQQIWISLHARTVLNEQGKPLYFQGWVTDVTAAHKLQERQQQLQVAFQEREFPLLQFVENAQQLFWITTADTREIIYINPACKAILGYSVEECSPSPKAWMRCIHPEDRWRVASTFKAQLAGEKTEVVFRCIRPDGQILWLRQHSFPIRDHTGKVHRIANLAEDITESKQLEAKRHQGEQTWQQTAQHFQHIFQLAPWGFARVDLQGRWLQVNTAFANLLGYRPEELKGRQQLDLVVPEDIPLLLAAHEALLTGAVSISQQPIRYTHRSGQILPLLVGLTLLPEEAGHPQEFLLQVIDISDRVATEQALKEQEAHFRQLFEEAPIAEVITNLQGEYQHINSAFTQTLGYTLGDLQGKTILDITHPEDVAATLENNNRLLAGSVHSWQEKKRYLHKNGYVIPALVCTTLLRTAQGDPHSFLIHIRDLPEQKAAADITQEKQVELHTQAALQEKEILLKEMHHRVKNNLQMLSSLLRLQASQIKSRKYARVFQDAGNRIQALSLLHEGLYQSGNLAAVDLSQYLHNLIANLFCAYGVNPEHIRASICAEGIRLRMEEAVLCGLIINELVTNSLKYAFPKGSGGEIHIHFHQTSHFTQLRVSDNGIGLPPGFDFKETQSLGLQLVATLTDQLQGTIESKSESGTTFVITFPRVES